MGKFSLSNIYQYNYMIFDFDGTIGDSNGVYNTYCKKLLSSYGIPFDNEFNEQLKTWDFPCLCHNICKKLNGAIPETELFNDFDQHISDFFSSQVEAMPGIIEFIKQCHLRGTKMCIVTASPGRHIKPAVNHLGIDKYIEHIVSPEMVHNMDKSNPDIYFKAMELMKHKIPADFCVFDDAIGAINTARSLGMFTVGVFDKDTENQKELMISSCHMFLHSFEELLA